MNLRELHRKYEKMLAMNDERIQNGLKSVDGEGILLSIVSDLGFVDEDEGIEDRDITGITPKQVRIVREIEDREKIRIMREEQDIHDKSIESNEEFDWDLTGINPRKITGDELRMRREKEANRDGI